VRILVVCHPNDAFDQTHYVVRAMADEWRKRADVASVEVASDLDAIHVNGKPVVVVPHLDVTVTPPQYRQFFAQCPVVLNRNVSDISKRKISCNLVTGPHEYDGAVIVKTNRNAGGSPEKSQVKRTGNAMARGALSVAKRLPWAITGMVGPLDYHVYDHPTRVPWAVWRNPRLVVEKFLPERHDGLYALRQYTFFGSKELNTIAFAEKPIVKARTVVRREVLPETPPALRELRASLGFDFGKFDYVMKDGVPVLFDANRTPTFNPASKAGSPSALLMALADGIEAFFP
jgi:hypothetical protein